LNTGDSNGLEKSELSNLGKKFEKIEKCEILNNKNFEVSSNLNFNKMSNFKELQFQESVN